LPSNNFFYAVAAYATNWTEYYISRKLGICHGNVNIATLNCIITFGYYH